MRAHGLAHALRYRMRSNGPHEVWLNREQDGSKVPYTIGGQPIHFGMTLISILRMGVTKQWREKLYGALSPPLIIHDEYA
jgi:hypothetical protein